MNKELKEQAEALFELVKDDCATPEIAHWLEEVANLSMSHMQSLGDISEDEMSPDDLALLTIMEPYLFLLGLALKNEWIARMDGEH